MKKRNLFLGLGMITLLGVSACNSNSLSISDADKVKPSSTSFDYVDYSEYDEANHDSTKWYQNTLKDLPLPDPFVLEDGDTYYIYGTTDRTGANSFDCYSTEDFNSFELHKNIYSPSSSTITTNSLFAPEVYKIGDKYYFYYSGSSTKMPRSGVNVLVSDNPAGPFVEYKGKDFNGNDVDYSKTCMITDIKSGASLSILDQTLLIEDDQIYMYYSVYDTGVMQYIVGLEMYDPVTPNRSTYKVLLRPGEINATTTSTNILDWECMKSFKVAEGPNVIQSPINGKYYLTYSVNHYPDRYYTVCYAEADEALGTYTKPYTKGGYWTNLLFGYAGPSAGSVYDNWEGFMSGCAHHNIFKVGDEYMIAYHAHKNRKDSSSGRMVCFDHVYFNEDGVPYTQGPSTSLQPLPSKISGYKNVAPKATIVGENVQNLEYINDEYVVEHYNLEQEQGKEAILAKGNSYIKLKLDRSYRIGGIQLVNSAFYNKMLETIDFIKVGDKNVILDSNFNDNYVDNTKEFIYPDSNFTYDFEDVITDEIIFGFSNHSGDECQINEIKIFGGVDGE